MLLLGGEELASSAFCLGSFRSPSWGAGNLKERSSSGNVVLQEVKVGDLG